VIYLAKIFSSIGKKRHLDVKTLEDSWKYQQKRAVSKCWGSIPFSIRIETLFCFCYANLWL